MHVTSSKITKEFTTGITDEPSALTMRLSDLRRRNKRTMRRILMSRNILILLPAVFEFDSSRVASDTTTTTKSNIFQASAKNGANQSLEWQYKLPQSSNMKTDVKARSSCINRDAVPVPSSGRISASSMSVMKDNMITHPIIS